jgi:N-hydroxyarylamine O-acetyltransferase
MMDRGMLLPDTKAYLERIGFSGPVKHDLDTLNGLVLAQLTHVPFEALDVWALGACPSLKLEDLYEKIVVKKRGGYCFELNTLFRALLNSLGFEAYQAAASLLDEAGNAAPPAHNVIICRLDGVKYLMDVGFGGPVPMGAMELSEQPQLGFRLEKRGTFYYLIRLDAGKERPSIRFRDIPAEPVEFEPLNFYVSQKPDIHFRNRILVSQRQPDGRVFRLVGGEFSITGPEGAQTRPVQTVEEVRQILWQYFGIAPETVTLRDNL